MALFVVRHQHGETRCPAADPDTGAAMLNHLSRSNSRQRGVDIVGEAVVKGEHTIYMIVEATDVAAVDEFVTPLTSVGTTEILPASTCARVITNGGCLADTPAADDALLDPEQACQLALEAGLVVHRAPGQMSRR
jgi:hypothetical protein